MSGIFKKKQSMKKAKLVIEIDAELNDKITRINEELKDISPDEVFDLNGLLEEYVRKQVNSAERELKKMKPKASEPGATAQ